MKRYVEMVEHQPVMAPRLNHLTAYLLLLRRKNKKAKKKLNKCIKECTASFNVLELDTCHHTQAVWFTKKQDKTLNMWSSQAAMNKMYDWHSTSEVDSMRVKFTLPLPEWKNA